MLFSGKFAWKSCSVPSSRRIMHEIQKIAIKIIIRKKKRINIRVSEEQMKGANERNKCE